MYVKRNLRELNDEYHTALSAAREESIELKTKNRSAEALLDINWCITEAIVNSKGDVEDNALLAYIEGKLSSDAKDRINEVALQHNSDFTKTLRDIVGNYRETEVYKNLITALKGTASTTTTVTPSKPAEPAKPITVEPVKDAIDDSILSIIEAADEKGLSREALFDEIVDSVYDYSDSERRGFELYSRINKAIKNYKPTSFTQKNTTNTTIDVNAAMAEYYELNKDKTYSEFPGIFSRTKPNVLKTMKESEMFGNGKIGKYANGVIKTVPRAAVTKKRTSKTPKKGSDLPTADSWFNWRSKNLVNIHYRKVMESVDIEALE